MRTIDEIQVDIEEEKKTPSLACRNNDWTTHEGILQELEQELRAALTADIPFDRLTEICEAERLIGETVYWANHNLGVVELIVHGYYRRDIEDAIYIETIHNGIVSFNTRNLGKAVFLTCAEAAAKLKEADK